MARGRWKALEGGGGTERDSEAYGGEGASEGSIATLGHAWPHVAARGASLGHPGEGLGGGVLGRRTTRVRTSPALSR